MDTLIDRIKKRLIEPLPANKSHQKMMKNRLPIDEIDLLKLGARKSAVLIMIYPDLNEYYLILTKRAEYEGVHSGQISLPGGKVEKEDLNLQHTALRETEEEVGINRNDIEVIGSLTELYIPPSNFIVKPFIGYLKQKPQMKAEEKEVDQIIEMPLKYLLETNVIKPVSIRTKNGLLKVNAYNYQNHIVWGATSMILAELADVLSELT